ncbi:SPOR domain-containing protein [Acetobacter estunensis]|uniref:SPOR domain-containing protein n=1 Tax=Acetobacter estunensis TaxID=104097 RepID=UPI001C2D015E|nr:SPOR domain-containing protein [Acetobacter estunensis]MBV1837895.1 SPOR domain-containing protein [Acetobacter estunensis]
MSLNDSSPPDPHADRLNRARTRERLVADYDDEMEPRRPARPKGGKAAALAALLPTDPMTRRLTYGAVGLGALLLVGIGGWSLFGHHQGGIPIYGPPPQPLREKPADPGGMELDGAIPPPDAPGGAARLAPGPEQPNPEALAAHYGETARSDPPMTDRADSSQPPSSPEALPDTVSTQPQDAAPPQEEPSSDTVAPPSRDDAQPQPAGAEEDAAPAKAPSRTEAAAAPKKEPHKVAEASDVPAATSSGPYSVQLAALDSEANAYKEWDRMKAVSPELFAGHRPQIEKVTHTNAIFYRLRTRGFDSMASARAFCDKLREHGHACNPLRP